MLTRRELLKGGAAALVSSILLPISSKAVEVIPLQSSQPPNSLYELNDWIWVGRNNQIVVGVSQAECGQGIYTGMAQVVAAEMDANWDELSVRFVTGRDAYRHAAGGVALSQFVGASTSINSFYERLRLAAAQARELFKQAGAMHFKVGIGNCQTENSHVINTLTGERISYGELLDYAQGITLASTVKLKSKEEWLKTIDGKKVKRVDTVEKVSGQAVFGIDVEVPDMLIGVPWMVPSYTGKIISIKNENEIRTMPGVVDLVITRQWNMNNMKRLDSDMSPNAIIVVAETFWQAKLAIERLDVEYELGDAKTVNTSSIDADNQARIRRNDLTKVVAHGDAKAVIEKYKGSELYHEAYYEMPYLTHATMEPCTSTCHVREDGIDVWGSIQGQDLVRQVLGAMFKLSADKIKVHNTYLGGSFGRKYVPDAAMHAAVASKAVKRPVKVIYTREVDMQHGYYRPGQIAHYEAVLNKQGYPEALVMRAAGQSLYWQVHNDVMSKSGWDETMVECVYNTIYDFPSLYVEMGHDTQPVSLSYMRGVGSMSNVFFYESFINELAAKAAIDEYQYRSYLLKEQRLALAVLDRLVEESEWNSPLPDGVYRGMAFNNWVGRHEAFTTPIGVVAEIQKTGNKIKINKVTCVLDCGHVVNPGLVEANIDGGVGFALTGTLKGKLHIEKGAIVENNFDHYPLLRLAEMPAVKVVTINTDNRGPQGVGEMSSAVVAPALASALHKATGKFFRSTPMGEL